MKYFSVGLTVPTLPYHSVSLVFYPIDYDCPKFNYYAKMWTSLLNHLHQNN